VSCKTPSGNPLKASFKTAFMHGAYWLRGLEHAAYSPSPRCDFVTGELACDQLSCFAIICQGRHFVLQLFVDASWTQVTLTYIFHTAGSCLIIFAYGMLPIVGLVALQVSASYRHR